MQFIGIREIHLKSRNLRKSLSFYQDLCGFPVLSYIKDKHAIFDAGSNLLYCHQLKSGEEFPGGSAAEFMNQFLSIEASPGEFDNNLDEVRDSEYKMLSEGQYDRNKRFFRMEDPDGNLVEVVEFGHWDM
jgi:catechol 2,3-dioxygenase-like lactoylglutathione lyase family enzyme